MSNHHNLHRNLSRLISRKGYTYRHLEELSKVPKSTIHRYATGTAKSYDLDALIAISDVFGVTLDDLIK
ncbi:MAG: helix-turn-helix transcriptional regulator [Oscillospiraceae bacterium]|nr:helix-turn-helix transcriptional regulator [Oscillospiraceae bacterium]